MLILYLFLHGKKFIFNLNFPPQCKIQPLIFVDENKDHIPNEYGKLNLKNIIRKFQNIIRNFLCNGWTLILIGTIFHTYNILTSI